MEEQETLRLRLGGRRGRYSIYRSSDPRPIELRIYSSPDDVEILNRKAREFAKGLVDEERMAGKQVTFIDELSTGVIGLNRNIKSGIASKAYGRFRNYLSRCLSRF
jgi:hypothetical protein